MSDAASSQFDGTVVIRTLDGGGVDVRGLTPIAASTLVFTVAAVVREYQATSRSPLLVAVRIAGNICMPPEAGWSSTTGTGWTGLSEPSVKLCSRMSPSGW